MSDVGGVLGILGIYLVLTMRQQEDEVEDDTYWEALNSRYTSPERCTDTISLYRDALASGGTLVASQVYCPDQIVAQARPDMDGCECR